MKKFPDNDIGGYYSGEDTTCGVICECGYGLGDDECKLWVSDSEIVRCPRCKRGYKTEFVVWQFESDEDDSGIS